MRELEHLLPDLTPPPGGLLRLQHSLHSRREAAHKRIHTRLPAMAAACALALVALAWAPAKIQRERRDDTLARALLQAATPSPLTDGIRVNHGAALLLPGGQANARIYLVASSPTNH